METSDEMYGGILWKFMLSVEFPGIHGWLNLLLEYDRSLASVGLVVLGGGLGSPRYVNRLSS